MVDVGVFVEAGDGDLRLMSAGAARRDGIDECLVAGDDVPLGAVRKSDEANALRLDGKRVVTVPVAM